MKNGQAQRIVDATVWQDKRGTTSDRVASRQPASVANGHRSRSLSTNTPRTHPVPFSALKAVPLQLWVNPIVKAEVQRQAAFNGLSASAQGADLLEEILRQKLHVQQAATLESVIEKSCAKAHRAMVNRLASLLVRIAFDTGHIRVLATNTLGM